MTLFGPDISNVNGGNLSIADFKAEGFSWVEAKVSQGNYFDDQTYNGYVAEANACGMPIIGYHYADASCSAQSQAETFQANGGGTNAMIDFEAGAGTITDYWNLVQAFNNIGINVANSYIPHWYWSGNMGGGDLSQVPGLIASSYVTGTGYASNLYPGDDSTFWNPYGGATPVMLQFTDEATIDGVQLDCNAFRGTQTELIQLLTGAPAPEPEVDMQLTDTLTNAAGQTVTVAEILSAIDFHSSMSLEQAAGPGTSAQPGPSLTATGWAQLGGRSIVDALAIIGTRLSIPGFTEGN